MAVCIASEFVELHGKGKCLAAQRCSTMIQTKSFLDFDIVCPFVLMQDHLSLCLWV
jgi:hypothetical protein